LLNGKTETGTHQTRSAVPLDPTPLITTWRTVRKFWGTAFGTFLTVTLALTFFTLGQTKIYQANGTVMFDPNPPRPLGKGVDTVVDLGAGSFWNNQEYYTTQYKIIQSMHIALAVVNQLGLHHDGGFLSGSAPGIQSKPSSTTPELAAELLRAHLTVEPIRESRLAIIRYEDADPARAQRIVSAIMDTYVEANLDDAMTSTSTAVDWLRGQLDNLKSDLESSEMALHEYKLSKNMLSVAFDDQSNMLREEMKQLNDVLTSARTKREEIGARRNELIKLILEEPSNLPASELLQSPLLQILRQRYEEAVRDASALQAGGLGTHHPEASAAAARVEACREALLAEVHNIQGAVDRDFAVVSRQEAGLATLFDQAKKEALDLNLREIEYNRLRRAKDNNEKLYQLILERTKESDLARMLRVNNIRTLDRPLIPRAPVRPRVAINIGLGILLGVLLGVAAASARAFLDRTLKTPDDVERDLGVPFLGLIPEIDETSVRYGRKGKSRRRIRGPDVNRELIVKEYPMSGTAEAARAIRTNLMFMAPDKPYKTILITSGGPAEGKTTVACCIAIAMAQAGQRVILIDCDLRRPRLHRIFNKSNDLGITARLLEPTKLDDTEEIKTDIPNLSVIPAGPIPPNPSELLHSERFKSLLKMLAGHYDRIIIDSPPIVAVTDATVLSTLVDGTILVAKAFTTRKDLARQALRAIADVGAKTAGTILNAVDLDRHEYKYYYYYYKKDGYYASAPGSAPSAQPSPPPS
jgi:capsular exopolysaccharide synthesis family protein